MARAQTEAPARRGKLLLPLGDGALLLCAMAGFALSFLSLYGSEDNSLTILLPVPSPLSGYVQAGGTAVLLLWAAVTALLALAVWSLPRFRWAAAGTLTAAWCLWLYWAWEDACLGAKLVCTSIIDMFSRRVGWIDPMSFESGLTAREDHAAIRLLFLLALSLLALLLGWAVARGRRWWLVMALTLPPLLPGLVADLCPGWPGFMLLCACWCTMLLTDLCRWAAPDRRGALTLTALPCVGAALLILSLALPMEGYTRPQWALDAQTAVVNWGSRNLSDWDWDGPFSFGGGVTFVGAAETIDLTRAGPLSYSGRTVLRVTTDYDAGERLYLRGASLAVYDGHSWSALLEGTYQEYLDLLSAPGFPSPLVFLSQSAGRGLTYAITVENVGASGACVYTPYQLLDQDWSGAGMLPVEDAYFAHAQGQWEHTMTFEPLQLHDGMYVQAYEEYVYSHYLDVPDEFQEMLSDMLFEQYSAAELELMAADVEQELTLSNRLNRASEQSGAIARAMLVGQILGDLCEYDADTPLTPEGEDFAEYFLFESRRGYCMHFASAAVLILRAMGAPARYVSGFTVVPAPGQETDVADRAAHAWVEVYVNGYGWYPVEVTPAAAFEMSEVPVPGGVEVPDEDVLAQPPEESETPAPAESEAPAPSADLPGTGEDENGGNGPDSAGFRLPAWAGTAAKGLLIALCAGALVWLGQYLPKRVRTARMTGGDTNRAALEAYRCLLRLEKWGGKVDEAALPLAQKARFSQYTLTPEEVQTMTGLFDEQRARLCVVLSPLERLAFRYLWGRPAAPEKEAEHGDDNL